MRICACSLVRWGLSGSLALHYGEHNGSTLALQVGLEGRQAGELVGSLLFYLHRPTHSSLDRRLLDSSLPLSQQAHESRLGWLPGRANAEPLNWWWMWMVDWPQRQCRTRRPLPARLRPRGRHADKAAEGSSAANWMLASMSTTAEDYLRAGDSCLASSCLIVSAHVFVASRLADLRDCRWSCGITQLGAHAGQVRSVKPASQPS